MMKKRLFSLLTALALCLTLVPAAVFAEDALEPAPVCVCQTRCTEALLNPDCPVCGAEGAQAADCAAPEAANGQAAGGSTPFLDIVDGPDGEGNGPDGAGAPEGGGNQPEEGMEDSEKAPGAAPEQEDESSFNEPEADEQPEGGMDGVALLNAENGIRVQASGGELWLGGVDVLQYPSGNSPNSGSYHYDSETSTLTLTNYVVEGANYKSFTTNNSGSIPTAAYLYTTMQALKIKLEGNCRFGESGNTTEYLTDGKTTRTVGIATREGTTNYIYINNMGGTGNLEINSHVWPLAVCDVTIYAGTVTLNSGMDGCAVRGNLTLSGSANVTIASLLNGRLAYNGAKINGKLTMSGNAKLTVTTNGVTYKNESNIKNPIALQAGSISVNGNGQLIATSSGSNTNDGCQGYGIYVNGNLGIYENGRVEAYSNGYNTKTQQHDGKEAIYVTGKLTMGSGTYLRAKTLNAETNNDDPGTYGALRLKTADGWDLATNDKSGKLNNNNAVVTYPVGGYFNTTYRSVFAWPDPNDRMAGYAAKEVTIQGLKNTVLALNNNAAGYGIYCYRDPNDTTPTQCGTRYAYSKSDPLDWSQGNSGIGPADYRAFYGIDVQSGSHTIVWDAISEERDHPYITVRSGATLTLELKDNGTEGNRSYLGNTNGGIYDNVIKVASGATLNIIGPAGRDYLYTALTLIGRIQAASTATVNFKNCIVYASGYIGSQDANVSVENCWIDTAGFVGNLTVQNSTVKGSYQDGTLTVDRTSNANLTIAGNITAKDTSGAPVYRTQIELEDFSSSHNKKPVLYKQTKDGAGSAQLCAVVTGLRLKSGTTATKLDNLSMLAHDNTIVLWLPFNTVTENVYGFDDGSGDVGGFIHDSGDNPQIVTKADHSTAGKLVLRNRLLAAGILAMRGTDALCAGYVENSSENEWIYYEREKEVKLQSASGRRVTGFGIRALEGADAEVKINGLDLVGERKRVEVDNKAKLSMVLMTGTENQMTANSDSTDAVLTLHGSGRLIIRGQAGGETLKLAGDHAIDASANASLTLSGVTLINLCTANNPETVLGSLTIKNSTVLGLGKITCSNIIIDGGSVDLDVPVGTIVKDSEGNELKKVALSFSEIETAIENIAISGLPEGTTFNSSRLSTDEKGGLYLWIPKDATIKTVTIGGKIYYPKADGNVTTGDAPKFDSPDKDTSLIAVRGSYPSLSVTVTGTPEPTLQWQISTDGGTTWTDIKDATESTCSAGEMTLANHGTKYRCVAANTAGTATSKTFTVYYCPWNVGFTRSSGDRYTFKRGETVTFTANLDNPGHSPFSDLTGVAVSYQWWAGVLPASQYVVDWTDIATTEDGTYLLTITDEMDYWRVYCRVTLTYPDQTVKDTSSSTLVKVVTPPVIETSPSSTTVEAGQPATFSVSVGGAGLRYYYPLHYQWQISRDGNTWTDIEGASGTVQQEVEYIDGKGYVYRYPASYTTPPATAELNGCQYRCAVCQEDFFGQEWKVSSDPVYSEAATLTVTGLPEITAQPQNAAVTYGEDASFRVTASVGTGEPLLYQWQVKTAADGAFADIDGATERSYTLAKPTVSMSGWEYRCIVRKENGVSVTSQAAALTVGKRSIAIPAADDTVYTYNSRAQTYGVLETADYTVSGGTQTSANETGHLVTLSLKDPANTQWTDGTSADLSFRFVIRRAAITITVGNLSAYRGSSLPAASEAGYRVSGLMDGESLEHEPALTYVNEDGTEITPDMTKTGTYLIRAVGASASGNYTISCADGKLTVSSRPSGGSTAPAYPVSSPGKTENGSVSSSPKNASTGDTVTITVEPDDGYELGDLIITDKNGNRVDAADRGNGKFTFVMPDGGVTIRARFVEKTAAGPFRDVPSSAYYYDAVVWAAKNGITGGIGSGLFGPALGCTRAQFVTFLWRAAGSPAPKAASRFTDVPADAYYADAVAWAVENGITDGTSAATFGPDEICTRAHAVTFLWRAFGKPEGNSAGFTDIPSGAYYEQAVTWAAEQGITTGVSDGRFAPGDTCTRAQIVTFLFRAYQAQ